MRGWGLFLEVCFGLGDLFRIVYGELLSVIFQL